ncbi:MarR family transcriptional regulator [Gordonia desulfuricans]|uniref:MarR family transcriptional regulator n=1 Tax=Gordonia desulfuricans TaxID=89051 RepID=A0A7K3LLM4_9ACTN|nr:MarR family transcriptional regulator [Gordonia desulfuricans]NDK89155.1 MarR family transcriptional regulator [Gordonia desulfuricans]
MTSPDVLDVASDLRLTLGGLIRRLRTIRSPDDPSVPETSVLARLDREGPTTAADLARSEQVTPQSMGATITGLLGRELIARQPDPDDGRRVLVHLTPAGCAALTDRRNTRTRALADALGTTLTDDELDTVAAALPLLARAVDALQVPPTPDPRR